VQHLLPMEMVPQLVNRPVLLLLHQAPVRRQLVPVVLPVMELLVPLVLHLHLAEEVLLVQLNLLVVHRKAAAQVKVVQHLVLVVRLKVVQQVVRLRMVLQVVQQVQKHPQQVMVVVVVVLEEHALIVPTVRQLDPNVPLHVWPASHASSILNAPNVPHVPIAHPTRPVQRVPIFKSPLMPTLLLLKVKRFVPHVISIRRISKRSPSVRILPPIVDHSQLSFI